MSDRGVEGGAAHEQCPGCEVCELATELIEERERVASLLLAEPSKTQGLYAAIDELRSVLEGERAARRAAEERLRGLLREVLRIGSVNTISGVATLRLSRATYDAALAAARGDVGSSVPVPPEEEKT